jgi:hypothetical protein
MKSQSSRVATSSSIARARAKLKATINQQIRNIDRLRGGKRVTDEQLFLDRYGNLYFRLRYETRSFRLESGEGKLKARNFDDLVEQLEQLKIAVDIGALDEILLRNQIDQR